MGFTISARNGVFGRATHRRFAADALDAARAYAAEGGTKVTIANELGEIFTPRTFAAAMAGGRFAKDPPR